MADQSERLIEHVARALSKAEGRDPDEPVGKNFATGQIVLAWHSQMGEARRHIAATEAIFEFAKMMYEAEKAAEASGAEGPAATPQPAQEATG